MSENNNPAQEVKLTRDMAISIEQPDAEQRGESSSPDTFQIAISSELPVRRWSPGFGKYMEVLDHTERSINLERMKDGAALLFNHDSDKHIGIIENPVIGPDKVLRGTARFAENQLAQEKKRDVLNGTLKWVSLQYNVREQAEVPNANRGGVKTVKVTNWEPLEVSLVTIPADPSVGVGRSEQEDNENARAAQELIEKILMREEAEKLKVVEAEQRADVAEKQVADLVNKTEVLRLSNEALQREAKDARDAAAAEEAAHARTLETFKGDLAQSAESCSLATSSLAVYKQRSEAIHDSASRIPELTKELSETCDTQCRELTDARTSIEAVASALGGSAVLSNLAKTLLVVERRQELVRDSASKIKSATDNIAEQSGLQTEGLGSIVSTIEGVGQTVRSVVQDFGRRILLRTLK